jgi:hypothetical protein
MKMEHVFVVECYFKGSDTWVPQVSFVTRDVARLKRDEYKHDNPTYKFRVKKYVREDDTWV